MLLRNVGVQQEAYVAPQFRSGEMKAVEIKVQTILKGGDPKWNCIQGKLLEKVI
jgi:hypothetical protein